MSDDDDTGGGKKHKTLQVVKDAVTQSITANKWTVAIAVVAFLVGYVVG